MSVWYRAGTVAVTNGSKTVTGTNTQWLNLMFGVMPGTTFYGPDGKPYEIDRVVSDTSLLLITDYSGATASAQAYSVDPTRSGSVASLAAQTSEVLKFSQGQFTQMQTWVTGASNVDVTLQAPSGQTVTVPSWKKISDTVSGQAAVAKQEADKAIAAAALAGDIVAQSALPLPDVWAPLSDSLRLITGYGRDVLVGSDVVARMVNFSRSTTATYIGKDGSLKTAAANEPRFEKDGLLIEGQSTNLLPTSAFQSSLNGWTSAGGGGGAGNVYTYGNIAPNGANEALKASFALDGLDRTLSGVVQVGTTYTFSFWAKNETATPVLLGIRINGGVSASTVTVPANTGWARYAVTQTAVAGDAILRLYTQTKNTEFYLWGMQLEALPFASSYIPTNGAAATRSLDVLTFPGAGNQPPIKTGSAFTIAMQLSAEESPVGYRDVLSSSGASFNMIRRVGSVMRYYRDGSGQNSVSAIGKKLQVSAIRVTEENQCSWRVGSAIKTTTETPAVPGDVTAVTISNLYGHIRDFRIWHSALNDNQFKAIA